VHELERSPSPRPGASSLPPLQEAKRVVLVRHGQSTWNAEGRIQGSSDLSVLTPKGESQAETSRQMLLSDSFDACFTSPLARSRRTAEIIWQGRHDHLIPDSDLREIDLYSFQVSIFVPFFFITV
jgi:probable phosphoglycerate mutase